MSSIRRLAIQFSHFFSGSMLSMLLGLITFPILTRLLTPEAYGMLGIVTTTIAMAVVAAKGGLSDGIVRFYKSYADSEERLTIFTSTVLVRGVSLASVVTLIYLFTLPRLLELIDVDARYQSAFLVMALYLWVRPLNIIVYNYLRALGRTVFYNIIGVVGKLCSVVLSLFLLIYVVKDLYGYFLGTAVIEALCSIVLFFWLLKHHRFRLKASSSELSWSLVRFGLPLIATELAYLLLRSGDRYLVQYFLGEAVVGTYAVGYTLPAYINDLVLFSVSYAIVPIYVELYGKEGKVATEQFLERAFTYFFIGSVAICAGYAAVANDLIVTLASEKYRSAAAFSPLILTGLIFLGANSILNAGLYLQKKTVQLLIVMLAGVAANVVTNLTLLPRIGVQAAAIATLVAGVTTTLLTIALSYRLIVVRLKISTAFYYAAMGVLLWLSLCWIDSGRPWLNLMIKLPLGALWVFGSVFYRERELKLLLTSRLLRRRND